MKEGKITGHRYVLTDLITDKEYFYKKNYFSLAFLIVFILGVVVGAILF